MHYILTLRVVCWMVDGSVLLVREGFITGAEVHKPLGKHNQIMSMEICSAPMGGYTYTHWWVTNVMVQKRIIEVQTKVVVVLREWTSPVVRHIGRKNPGDRNRV